MPIIKKDSVGLWVAAGGYVARPVLPTTYTEGDEVKTHHFGGSTRAGVGKDPTCMRGQYIETWTTTGAMAFKHSDYDQDELRLLYLWYRADSAMTGNHGPDAAGDPELTLPRSTREEILDKIHAYRKERRKRGDYW